VISLVFRKNFIFVAEFAMYLMKTCVFSHKTFAAKSGASKPNLSLPNMGIFRLQLPDVGVEINQLDIVLAKLQLKSASQTLGLIFTP
jgi:hypothetical protein